MKPHKMILKFAYGVVGLSVVVMIALIVYQQQQIRKIIETGSPAASADKPLAEVRGNADVEKKPLQNADPDIDEFKHALDTVDISYAALFKKLALPPEKQAAFRELLIDLQMENTALNMEMPDTSRSEEKREEIRQRLETLKNEGNEKIGDFLGTDNYETYLTYKERLGERMLITAFMGSLGPDEKLTETQEQAFVDSMFEERKKVEAALPLDNEVLSPADLNETQIARVMETMDQTYSGYAQVAGTYLSPSRTEQFKIYLNQQRNMTEMSLNMAHQAFGSNPVSDQSPEEPVGETD